MIANPISIRPAVTSSTLTITASNACSNQTEIFCIATLIENENLTILDQYRCRSDSAWLYVQSKYNLNFKCISIDDACMLTNIIS